jgi:hypothetical protein
LLQDIVWFLSSRKKSIEKAIDCLVGPPICLLSASFSVLGELFELNPFPATL